jgi:hypothetical protein
VPARQLNNFLDRQIGLRYVRIRDATRPNQHPSRRGPTSLKTSKTILGILLCTLPIVGCESQPEPSPLGQPGTFAIKEIASEGTPKGLKKTWLATVSDESGKPPFQFRLEMLLKPLKGELPMAFSEAALIREQGNDGRPFLEQIAKVIGAKSIPKTSKKADRLDFSIAILGSGLSRHGDEHGSGFSSQPAGDWTTTKAFLGEGEAEVFLNFNEKLAIGEFSPKDSEYADGVVAELAKVFLP